MNRDELDRGKEGGHGAYKGDDGLSDAERIAYAVCNAVSVFVSSLFSSAPFSSSANKIMTHITRSEHKDVCVMDFFIPKSVMRVSCEFHVGYL